MKLEPMNPAPPVTKMRMVSPSAISTWEWSPSMKRWAAGRRSVRCSTTSRPSREPSMRSMSVTVQPVEDDGVLDLGALEHAVLRDRGERADVAVDDPGVLADDRRAPDGRVDDDRAPGLDDHLAGHRRVGVHARPRSRSSVPSTIRLASSSSSFFPVSSHQPSTWRPARTVAVVDQPLDRVGDLELAPPRRLDPLGGVEDRRREQVDPDEREVARRVLRLLHQPQMDPSGSAPPPRTARGRGPASAGSARRGGAASKPRRRG
jgi:hypothetical protein